MFGSCSPTTCPGSRPVSRRLAAKRPDCPSSSRYVITVPPARLTGASGEAIAVSDRMVARLKLIRPPFGRVARGAIYVSETYINCVSFSCLGRRDEGRDEASQASRGDDDVPHPGSGRRRRPWGWRRECGGLTSRTSRRLAADRTHPRAG